jgi:hypothetical protein
MCRDRLVIGLPQVGDGREVKDLVRRIRLHRAAAACGVSNVLDPVVHSRQRVCRLLANPRADPRLVLDERPTQPAAGEAVAAGDDYAHVSISTGSPTP